MWVLLRSIMLIFIFTINNAFALIVPFQNIPLVPNNVISATYNFGQHPIIFCYENNQQSVGIMTWPYKGKIYSATLSTSLTNNPIYEGSFADQAGVITVTNNTGSTLIVSCDFGF